MTLTNILPGGRGNAVTTLTASYVAGSTETISVGDATKLPAGPNIITILDPELLGNRYVVVQYAEVAGNVLTGLTVIDGVPNTSQTFGAGAIVTRALTKSEWDTILDHIANVENPHGVSVEQIEAAPAIHATQHENGGDDEISIDASQVTTGLFDIARIPQAALERIISVADDTARFALTTATVQLGDTVKVASDGYMYIVVDEANLSSEAGYVQYKALPTPHASSHTAGGSDAITVGAAQLSGIITPKAEFTWAEDDATVSNTINFADASTTGTLPITSRYWDFGDGSSSTEQNPSHTYAGFGIYQVSLTVVNAAGQGAITKSVTVVSAPIFGYRIIDAESGPAAKVEYIEAAAGMTPVHKDTETGVWDLGDWSSTIDATLNPSVLLANAAGYKDLDKTNLALYTDATPSPLDLVSGNPLDGDVCCRISHLIYEQITRVGNDEEHRFCSKQPDPSYVMRAHRYGDEKRAHRFLGMFEGIVISSTLYSRYSIDTFPTASTKQDTYRSYTTEAKKGAATYGLKSMHTDDLHTSLSVLFLKTLNFQGAVGNGNSTSDVYLKSGEGLDLQGGMLQGDTTATDKGVMLFWVWNKYGNYFEDVDGFVKIEDGKYWVNRTNKDFLNIEALPTICPDNYDEVLLPTPASGYIRRMSADSRAPQVPIVTGSPADGTHHYCDYFSKDVGLRKLVRGGYRFDGAYCGPFYSYVNSAVDVSISYIVARLQGFLAAE